MIEKSTVSGIKKEEVYRLCIQTDICSIVRMAKIFYIRRSFDLEGGELCDKLQRNSEMIHIKSQ